LENRCLTPIFSERPLADERNKHREIMMTDITGPLAGKAFKFHQTDPATGRRSLRTVEAAVGGK
jgi:cytolysin-activating lysine-acyltransferase